MHQLSIREMGQHHEILTAERAGKDGNLLPECPVQVSQESLGRASGRIYGQIFATMQFFCPTIFHPFSQRIYKPKIQGH